MTNRRKKDLTIQENYLLKNNFSLYNRSKPNGKSKLDILNESNNSAYSSTLQRERQEANKISMRNNTLERQEQDLVARLQHTQQKRKAMDGFFLDITKSKADLSYDQSTSAVDLFDLAEKKEKER